MHRRCFLAALAALALTASEGGDAQEGRVTVFAAASLAHALKEVNAAFAQQTGIAAVASHAASSALMRQIKAGAPADVFISADESWVDYGVEKKLLRPETRVDLLGNRLVLIAPKEARLDKVTIGPGFDLAALAGNGRVATGDVQAVPVGRYAKAALESLGAWDNAADKFVMAENVRAALVFVARGEAALGIVYATDAAIEPNVKVIGTFPADSHPPIIYPAALTTAHKGAGANYLAFLRSKAARAIFERHGFRHLAEPEGT